ncbi:MAG: 50S ribosomal protein L5 [Patescibacteria group bacterium]
MDGLRDKFKKQIAKDLQKTLGLKNPEAVPSITKIVVNMGVKDVLLDKKNLDKGSAILAQITGQKPKWTSAKKSISTFKLREGDRIGLAVTLRGKRMYDFFERLTNIVLPRLRDFHGLNKNSFDGRGNYSIGFSESTVFPEIDPGKIDQTTARQGLEVSIVTNCSNDKEGFALLKALGMPFEKVKS